MFQITKAFLIIFVLFIGNNAISAPLINGHAVFEAAGLDTPITGDIHLGNRTMFVDNWQFFGAPVITQNVELLDPGTYTRIAGDVTIPAGHIGAHVEVSWLSNVFYTYMVWEVTGSGSRFTIIDSDNDGALGHALTNGPFIGVTVYYEFDTTPSGPPQPNVFLVLSVQGGSNHECTGVNGAEVTIDALPSLVGGAVLESVSWVIDGDSVGTGLSLTDSLTMGSHQIEAVALTTTGQSDTESVTVIVRDTTRPVVNVAFIDNKGNDISNADSGKVDIDIDVTDICDPEPVITSSTATPTATITNGDSLLINKNHGIKLPVTAVRVTVTARDASGNFSLTTSGSSRVLTLD